VLLCASHAHLHLCPQRTTTTTSTSNTTAVGAQKSYAVDAQPRRFGTNVANQQAVGQDAVAQKTTVPSRPRTAGGVTKESSGAAIARDTIAAKCDGARKVLTSVKVDDIAIPDAGVDSSQDKKNPQQVCAYVNDIMSHMRQQEAKYMPDANYMENIQSASGLAARHRVSLIDWVTEVHRKFKTLRQETLFLAINVIDRFLSKRQVAKDKLQLVGATCLLIASKVEDMWPPLVRDLVYVASNAFTKQDLKKMERTVCNAIRFEVVVPTIAPFLARYGKAGGLDSTGKQLASYIAELGMHKYEHIKYAPSMVAASSVALAMRMRGKGGWTSTLQTTSTYSESQILACMRDINELVKAPPAEMKSVKNKYSTVSSTRAVDI